MRNSYMGKWQPPVELIKNAASSIKIEGLHTFDTTNKTTYQNIEGDHRPDRVIQKETTPLKKRGLFEGKTQTMADFPGYKRGQPRPPKAVEPAPATIDLKFNNKRSFSTENRAIYRGHNVIDNPVPESCKVKDEEYAVPSVKIETETSQKRDYKPIKINAEDYGKVAIPKASMGVPVDAEFDSKTMNNEFFQNWGIQPRVRYGDFHENRPYIPPRDPFSGESITQSSFHAKKAEPVKLYKPEPRPISKSGEVDFNTVYQSEFQKKELRMNRAKVFVIQQELRRRKQLKEAAAAENAKCASAPLRNVSQAGSTPIAQQAKA